MKVINGPPFKFGASNAHYHPDTIAQWTALANTGNKRKSLQNSYEVENKENTIG